jgi:hypothetical protein
MGEVNVHPDDVHQISMQMVMLNPWHPFHEMALLIYPDTF